MSDLYLELREFAFSLGFCQMGIAPAEEPLSAPAFSQWLDEGMHGEMDYLAREPHRRRNPRVYWPEARSIIAVSMPYDASPASRPTGALEGRIARYARGDDYHDILKARLRQLGRFLTERAPESKTIAVVDTSAILERAHAARAGLGWIAKNAMLLSRDFGSSTALGFLLTDLELEPDRPVSAHCGSCRRCIEACPTGAIVAERVVDARRCISYLTIELKGLIPEAYRSKLEGWLFGCDICQEVCPWVRKHMRQPKEGELVLMPDKGRELVALEEILLESREDFSKRWRKSPLKRSKRRGLARNAATLLGNSPNKDGAVSILERAIEHPEPLVRAHVAWALGQQGGERALEALESLRARERDPAVLAEIETALG